MKKLLTEALLVAAAMTSAASSFASIQITEWAYQGSGGEFVELTNTGGSAVDMTGWSFDDNSQTAGSINLSSFGVVAPGEAVVLTDLTAAAFRTEWGLSAATKVIGENSQNLGRADEINLYDASNARIDWLTYDDQTIGGPRTNVASANPQSLAALGAHDFSAVGALRSGRRVRIDRLGQRRNRQPGAVHARSRASDLLARRCGGAGTSRRQEKKPSSRSECSKGLVHQYRRSDESLDSLVGCLRSRLQRLILRSPGAPLTQSSVPTRTDDGYLSELLSRFDVAYRSNDLPVATDCFNRLAEFRYLALLREPGFDPSRPSVISSFAPKSGGTFLHNRMLEAGFKEYWWFFPRYMNHSRCIPSEDALPRYLLGGCTSHSHFLPEESLIAALDARGVDKIWVHLRNPAECVVSAYHHFQGRGHGEGVISEMRRLQAAQEAAALGIRLDASISEFAVEHIEFFVDWAESWLQFDATHPGRIVLSYFSELSDPSALLRRVFDEFGVQQSSSVSRKPKAADRYRKKEGGDWHASVKPEIGHQLERLMYARLRHFRGFQWLFP